MGSALCAGALALVFCVASAAAACPNEALRQQQNATALPECMALEMVSPPRKFSQPAFLPIFAREGERLVFTAEAALAETPGYQYFGGDRYVATRLSSEWDSAATSPLLKEIVGGGNFAGNPTIFTHDLGGWAQLGANQAQVQLGISQLFRGGLGSPFALFSPLSPLMVPIDDSGAGLTSSPEVNGGSADLSTVVLRVGYSTVSYFSADPRGSSTGGEPGGDRNSYVAFLDEARRTDPRAAGPRQGRRRLRRALRRPSGGGEEDAPSTRARSPPRAR